jgi:putative MFS transporter
MLFDSWDSIAIAYAMPTLSADWQLNPLTMGFVISAGYGGQFIGALSLGAIAERFGRLPVFIVAAAVMCVLALGCAFAHDYMTLLVLRFFQGIMIGGAMPVAITYVNELAPTKTRGRYFGIFQTLAISGFAIASLSSPFIIPHLGWRWMFGLGAIPIVLLPLVWMTLPESPRWLVRVGRLEAANKALVKLGGAPVALVDEARRALDKTPKVGVLTLVSAPMRSRTLTITLLWFLTLFASFGLTTWVPSFYVKAFHIPVEKALGFSAITSLLIWFALVISGFLIDKFGRRPLAFGGLFAAACALLGLAVFRPTYDLVLFSMFTIAQIAMFFAVFTIWPYTAEIYPTNVRALALGYGSSVGRGASMLMPIFVGFVMNRGAPIQIVLTIFGLFAVGALAVWITRTRETAGKPLETS